MLGILITGLSFGQPSLQTNQPTAPGTITGTVLDSTTQIPMQYANLVVYRQGDSVQVGGATSGKDGRFRVTGLPAGRYFLEASFVGYKKQQIDNIRIAPPEMSVNVGTIMLAITALNSSGVVVEGQRSQMELSFEKRVFQVGSDITSMGGSVLDLLNNVPSLQADFKGNISLRGSNAVRVLINGKPSRIYQNGSLALQNLPADMIKEIQVITNPSAKYAAEGSAGIINIILKKKQAHGFHGNVGIMQRRPEASQVSTNLNYRSGKINWFFNGGGAYAADPAYHRMYQRFHSADTSYIYHAYNDGNETDYHGDFQLGTDVHFTPKQTLTASTMWHFEN
ncbi:MAG: TonB-dependent receptor, partial [Calditrichota bacterium]